MIGGKIKCNLRDGNVATGRVQNGRNGHWLKFSASWDSKRWTVVFTEGSSGIRDARLPQLAQKVAQSLGTPVLKAA